MIGERSQTLQTPDTQTRIRLSADALDLLLAQTLGEPTEAEEKATKELVRQLDDEAKQQPHNWLVGSVYLPRLAAGVEPSSNLTELLDAVSNSVME